MADENDCCDLAVAYWYFLCNSESMNKRKRRKKQEWWFWIHDVISRRDDHRLVHAAASWSWTFSTVFSNVNVAVAFFDSADWSGDCETGYKLALVYLARRMTCHNSVVGVGCGVESNLPIKFHASRVRVWRISFYLSYALILSGMSSKIMKYNHEMLTRETMLQSAVGPTAPL